jgi:hypothetical protein
MRVLRSEDGQEYLSMIYSDGKSGAIIIPSGAVVVSIAATSSSHEVKKKLKAELIKLGVLFENEARTKRTIRE